MKGADPGPLPCLDSGPGDARIQALLERAVAEGGRLVPARACRLDGFVDDTVTEYANPSVLRPPAVRASGAETSLTWVVDRSGRFYVAFTLYTPAGDHDRIELWVGHRLLGTVHISHGDNRIHLFSLPRVQVFRGGEAIRLVASGDCGTCRIESLAMLTRRPASAPGRRLTVREIELVFCEEDTGPTGRVTFLSNRPATGRVGLRRAGGRWTWRQVDTPLQNHEAQFTGLRAGDTYEYRLELADAAGLALRRSGRKRCPAPRTRLSKRSGRNLSIALLARRPAAGEHPVSIGVPLPMGACAQPESLELVAGRRLLPAQFQARGRWPDGSLKWVLVDFHGDGSRDLRLRSRIQAALPPDRRGFAHDAAGGLILDTGVLRLTFDRPAHQVWPTIEAIKDAQARPLTDPEPRQDAEAVEVVGDDGKRWRRDLPEAVVLEESGPLRACVRVTCRHRSGDRRSSVRSVFRFHAWAGSGRIRVCHWLELDSPETRFTRLRSAALRLDLRGVSSRLRLEGDERRGRGALRVRQMTDGAYQLTTGGSRLVRRGRRARGLARLTGPAGSLSVSVLDFWQRYPSGLQVDDDGLTLEICPPLEGLVPRGRAEEVERLAFHQRSGAYELRTGVALGTEMWLHYTEGAAAHAADLALHESVQRPALYSVQSAHLNRCGVLPGIAPKAGSPRPAYEHWVSSAQAAYALSRKQFRAYGQLSYGDWFGERFYNWGNLEYDTPWAFLQEFARGGDPDFRDWAEQAARHLVDVDTVHHAQGGTRVGWQYSHCVGHVGGYYPEGYRERAQFSGRWSPSHTWVEGLFALWLLGGERRYMESALMTSQLLTGDMVNDYDFSNCRNSGWHLIHLCAAHAATGRRVFLNASRLIVDRVLERQRPSGGWDRLMVPGHCHCEPPRHRGNAGFMVGILLTGLQRFHEVTGDRRVAEAIVAAADFCVDRMWDATAAAFRYTCCPHSSLGGGADMRILKGVAFAYRFTHRQHLRDVLEAGFDSAVTGGGPGSGRGAGKGISARMRGAAQVLAVLPPAKTG